MTKFFRFCTKTALASTVALVSLSIVLVLACLYFLWRVSVQPVDINFAKPTIERALSKIHDHYTVNIGSVVVHWPRLQGPILLRLQDLDILETKDTPALSVDKAVIGVSRSALLLGQIKPRSILIEGPSLQLVRKAHGVSLSFQGQPVVEDKLPEETSKEVPVETIEGESLEKTTQEQIISAIDSLSKSSENNALSDMLIFEVRDANLAVRDFVNGASWYIQDFDFSYQRERKDLLIDFAAKVPGGVSENAGFKVSLRHFYNSKELSAKITLQDMDPLFFTRFVDVGIPLQGNFVILNGTMDARFDSKLNLVQGDIALNSSEGKISIPQEFDEPISYQDMRIALACQNCQQSIDVKTIGGVFETVPLQASGTVSFDDNMNTITLPLTVKGPNIPLSSLRPLYPKSELEGEAAKWLLHRLTVGGFQDVQASTTIIMRRSSGGELKEDDLKEDLEENSVEDSIQKPSDEKQVDVQSDQDKQAVTQNGDLADKEWNFEFKDPRIDFSFDKVTINYSDGLMPAVNAKGKGVFDFDSLVVEGQSATIGETIQASDILLTFTDIMILGGGLADIKTNIKGPLAKILKYTADEPIGFGDTLGFDLNKVKGEVAANIHVRLPTTKDLSKDDVKVVIDGKANDVLLPGIVKGLSFAGGPLQVKVKDGAFTVDGSGKLAGRAIKLAWKQFFDPKGQPFEAQVKADLLADTKLRHHFGVELDEYISGTMPVNVTYTDTGGSKETVDVIGDLRPMKITIEPFDYEKPSGVPGKVRLKATMKNDVLQHIKNLQLTTDRLSVSDGELYFDTPQKNITELRRGLLPMATIGKTISRAEFEISPDNNVLKVIAHSSIFDAEPFLKGQETKDAIDLNKEVQPLIVSLQTPKMLTKNGYFVSDVQLYAEVDKTATVTQLEMDALSGQGDIYLRYKPNPQGRREFRLEASDAGATLQAFDIYDNMRGGKILVFGEPIPGTAERDITGVARIDNFKIVNAPGLARLISAMSLSGLGELLNSDGIKFRNFESQFEWRSRPQGALIRIRDGRTSGSTLGLSLEGTMDRAESVMDFMGTIVPISEVNSFISQIPLIGDLLTGGPGGGLIAATYTMKGPVKDPKVIVNPLSVLAPGFLRKILFEGGYEETIPPESFEDEK